MHPTPQEHGRGTRLALVLLALLLLLALVAFASRSGVGRTSSTAPTPGYVNWAMSVFLVVFVLMIPWAVYSYMLQVREYAEKSVHVSFQQRLLKSLGMLFLVFGIGAIVMYARTHHSLFGLTPAHVNAKGLHAHVPPSAADHYQPTFQWPVLWGTIALFAAAAAWYVWYRRRHPATVRPWAAPTIEEDVAASIGDALDDLEAEPDARRAVIAAYARMENVLGRHGLRRRASETPIEYMRRVLLGLTSRADAVARLTGLFEQAKFSLHDIDGSMKNDAIDALRAIRNDLQAAPA
jgi:hypothetical protein